jgi:two-component system, cell cycle sensor histidine kinase and response regulator CckA
MKVLSSGIDVVGEPQADLRRTAGYLHPNSALTGTEAILLVDDEPMMRGVLGTALERYGYSVLAAHDGERAMEVASAYGAPIHLVLSDVVMPRLNGCALITALRRWYPSIGVLLMSGLPEGGDAALQIDDDLTFFIQKPFTMDALAAAVRSALEWRPNHGPAE